MTKEQFDQLYTLAEQAMQELQATKYVCKSCGVQATVTEKGATKPCECDAPIVVNMDANMFAEAKLN